MSCTVLPAFAPEGLFSSLVNEIPFQSVKWGSRGRVLPRKVARFAYDEIANDLHRMPVLENVINLFCTQVGVDPSRLAFWFNLYEDGNHYTPYHRDSYGCTVYTISFGGSREFLAKNDADGRVERYTLNDGDLMIFDEEWDRTHMHSVPKTKNAAYQVPRISMVIFVEDD
jgi:alkylated DNA repair dioxygenase AlkB